MSVKTLEVFRNPKGQVVYLPPKPGVFRATRGEKIIGVDFIPPMTANLLNIGSVARPTVRGIADVPLEARSNFSWVNPDDIKKYKAELKLPVDFMSNVYNQGLCGSCWAVSTAQSFSDRWAIANRTSNPRLSPTFLLTCAFKFQSEDPMFSKTIDKPMQGCDGGWPAVASDFISKIGITDESCYNYDWCEKTSCATEQSRGEGGNYNYLLPKCPAYNSCSNFSSGKFNTFTTDKIFKSKNWKDVKTVQVPDVYYQKIDDLTQTVKMMSSIGAAKTFVIKPYRNREEQIAYHQNVIDDIKEEIFKRGPVVACYDIIYPTFFGVQGYAPTFLTNTWIDGIYIHVDSDKINNYYEKMCSGQGNCPLGGHAVAIVGWGEQTLDFNKVPDFLKPNYQFSSSELADPELQRIVNVYKSLQGKKIPYWIIRNSWGTGSIPNHTNGYFKIAMSNVDIGFNRFCALDVPKEKYGAVYGGVTAMLPEITAEVFTGEDTNKSITDNTTNDDTKKDISKHKTQILASGKECGQKSLISSSQVVHKHEHRGRHVFSFRNILILIILIAIIIIVSKK